MQNATACNLCQATATAAIQTGVRHDPTIKVIRCSACGFVFLDPLPSEDALTRFYSEDYRNEHEPGMSPAQAYRQELPEARIRVDRLKPLLGQELSLLEIGSSSGAFLDSVRPFVRNASGIEPARRHREWAAHELKLHLFSSLEDPHNGRYDRIVLFHVLEHIRRPADFIKALLGHLNPNGRIVIEVPNVDDALVSLYQIPTYAPFYYQNAHLWYFSAATLAKTAGLAGAKSDIRGLQRYGLSNHLRWMLTGKPGGAGFYDHIFPESLNLLYGEAMVRAGHADTLWAVLEAQP